VRNIFPDATILRPCVLFGRQDFFLNKYASIHRYWPVSVRVCKHHKMQPLWVSDMATALLNALARTDCVGKTIDLGGPEVLTFEDLTNYIAEITMKKRPWIDLPPSIMLAVASISERIYALPRYTTDEIVFMNHHDSIVPAGSHNATAELGVPKPATIHEIGLSFLRAYRSSVYQNLVE